MRWAFLSSHSSTQRASRLSPEARPTYYLNDPLFLDYSSNLERCEAFYIHPTFQAALDVQGT